jgi:GNAT superfamily N-acetyltransferase
MTGPDVGVDMADTPPLGTDTEDNQAELPASKLRAGHPDRRIRSAAWINPTDPTGDLATTRDGTTVHLRLLRRDERELVARFFAGLSEESRRRRFLQPMPRLPEAMLRRLVEVDGHHHVAVVAEVDGRCVGIARYLALADEPGAAEVAVTVTDRYQGRGIGRLLVQALRPLAVHADLTSLVYLADPTNRPALRLLRSLGVELAFRDGLVRGRQRLPSRPLHASGGSGPPPGEWPCRAGPSTRQLPDPHPYRSLDPSCASEGPRSREPSRRDARQQEDGMHNATAIDPATRR